MSCGSSCPGHSKWQTDTQGSKRDPINSEKAWLDFAVRLLSREVVGKGKGQETVWNERCKPQWWDLGVKLPWKNPTSNPKDTKEVLLKKYTALEMKLREEDRFPQELEEEARLWNEGKYRELFLQTSLVSLLGKVTGVHMAAMDAFEKVKELKAQVNLSLVTDLQQCLLSTLQVIDDLKTSGCRSNKSPKRSSPRNENIEAVPEKQKKFDNSALQSEFTQTAHATAPCSVEVERSQGILNCEQVSKRKYQTRTIRSVKKCEQKLQPKPLNAAAPAVTMAAGLTGTEGHFETFQPVLSSNNNVMSHNEISNLLLGNLIVCRQPDVLKVPYHLNLTSSIPSTQIMDSLEIVSANTDNQSFNSCDNFKVHSKCPNNVDNDSTNTCHSNISNYQSSLDQSHDKHNSVISEIDFLLSPTNNFTNNLFESLSQNSLSYKVNSQPVQFYDTFTDMAISSPVDTQHSSDMMASSITTSESGQDQHFSDSDFSTEHSQTDHMYDHIEHARHDEQNQLWKEDGSYLLDRFLEDLDASTQDSMSGY